jgi:hypothetical protein
MTDLKLEPIEARVLGVLVEKALTTPENYPLSLNAVTNGANQKSNRDPVLDLLESEVYQALQTLLIRNLVGASHPAGGRVEKFRHNGEALFEVDTSRLAILAELMMRGPQTPGELRARVNRMAPIEGTPALMDLLRPMIERGLVQRLPPKPGSRAELYAQTVAPGTHPSATATPVAQPEPAPMPTATVQASEPNSSQAADADSGKLERRVTELENEVGKLRRQLGNLAWKLGEKLES